jgi:glycine cleavage system aminomethyltransferase T
VTRATRRSPMAHLHSRHGAQVEERAGWQLILSYGDAAAERAAIRKSIGVGDVTPRGKVDVRGDIDGPLRGVIGGVLARISDEWALVLTEPGEESTSASAMTQNVNGAGAMVTDVTHAYAGLAVAGPACADACARLTSWNPETLRPGAATGASFAEVPAVLVRRPGRLPILEVLVAAEFGRYVWETLVDVAVRLEGRPVGWEALRAEGWR